MAQFTIKKGDVLDEPSDLLLLKFAQNFHGADRAVASRLTSAQVCMETDLRPPPGEFVLKETNGVIAADRVLLIGTPHLRSFTYDEMQVFARTAIEKITSLSLSVRIITTTIHGTGYGLDGGEALQRLIQGFQVGLKVYRSNTIERITFMTLGSRELKRLKSTLDGISTNSLPDFETNVALQPNQQQATPILKARDASEYNVPQESASKGKKRVFVALPFSEEFQNVYDFGIYPAVRNCGLICERVDETHFTGDILARIRSGIESADLVIADLTEGRPNVYLEVGYAWGRGVPVIFVAKKKEKLHFDVSTHKCVFYGRFTQFAKDLEDLIRGLMESNQH
jgi:hypothetical protein